MTPCTLTISYLIAGAVLLVCGRKLFWLVIGAGGFLLAMEWTRLYLAAQPAWVALTLSVAAGIAGAVLAVLLKRIAFAAGGFCAGAFLALQAAPLLGTPGGPAAWFLVGGILGALFAVCVLDWAVIALTCLAGSAAVVTALHLSRTAGTAVFAALLLMGILIQSKRFPR